MQQQRLIVQLIIWVILWRIEAHHDYRWLRTDGEALGQAQPELAERGALLRPDEQRLRGGSVASQLGIKLTQFGSNDENTQLDQIQTAEASGRYNAWIVAAYDPVQECNQVLSIAKRVPVLILNQGLCHVADLNGGVRWRQPAESRRGGGGG